MSLVLIIDGEFKDKAATIVQTGNEESTIKLLNSDQEIVINNNLIKRKKPCSCSKSRKYPFCDGSHSGS